MILMNHPTAKSNMRQIAIKYKIYSGLVEAVCKHPCRMFFFEFWFWDLNLSLLAFTIYILYFSCIKNKYWLFVIQKL